MDSTPDTAMLPVDSDDHHLSSTVEQCRGMGRWRWSDPWSFSSDPILVGVVRFLVELVRCRSRLQVWETSSRRCMQNHWWWIRSNRRQWTPCSWQLHLTVGFSHYPRFARPFVETAPTYIDMTLLRPQEKKQFSYIYRIYQSDILWDDVSANVNTTTYWW